jgi:hypothetical protein
MGRICDTYAMTSFEAILIRPVAGSDEAAVRAIAERDSRTVPAGMLLVAEADGQLRAVLSLDTGEIVADPFAPSAALVDLLRTRARQLGRGTQSRRKPTGTRDAAGRLALRPSRRRLAIPWTKEPSLSD